MTIVARQSRGCPGMVSRRRVLSGFLAAASATALHPLLSDASLTLAQTPSATPTESVRATLPSDASEPFRAVAEALAGAMEATGTPGAALGILADGREEHAAFGLASVEGGDAVAAETLFQTGSVTKTFTGTAVMRLVEAGALDLEATVRTYLPDLRLEDEEVAERVTVRHLLTHTGGWWGDLFADTGSGDDAIEQYVARWFPELPQLSPLGEFFSYNNAGFILLGRLIEAATGQEYRAAVDELVLRPLGLGASLLSLEPVATRPHALGHFTEAGDARIQEPLFLPRSTDPAGGLWSTTQDLLRYARFHLGDGTVDGKAILSPESLTLMQTPQQPIVATPGLTMALPWFVAEFPGRRLLFHEGSTFGQYAQLWLAPDERFALALLANAMPGGAIAAQPVLAEAFARYLDLAPAAMAVGTPAASPPPAVVAPTDLEPYAGRYATPDTTYVLSIEEGALVLAWERHPLPEQVLPALIPDLPPRSPVQFVADDLALVTIAGLPLPLGFVRREGGEIGWISASLRLIPKVEAA